MKIINRYIAKNFLLRFLQITLGFSLLFFFINLIDDVEKVKGTEISFFTTAFMAFLQIPQFLNDVVSSLVLIAAIITFSLLSSKSEVTIMRMSGFSLWQIWRPIALSSLLLGIFWIAIFGPISIEMIKKFNALEAKYVRNESREVIAPQNGIWLKQTNAENPEEELIIQTEKIYKNAEECSKIIEEIKKPINEKIIKSTKRPLQKNCLSESVKNSMGIKTGGENNNTLEFDDVTIWYFNKDNQFYKKIDAKKMFLQDDFLLLYDVTLNSHNTLNKRLKHLSIPSSLKADFILEKVVNNFENVKLFSIFNLPNLIAEMQSAGFASTKFQVYFHSLLIKPFLFLAMTLIACYFGLNHIRNQNAILMIFIGILIGLVLYITSSIITALGSSGLISISASTWVITIICMAIGTLLVYRKENM